MPLAAGAEVVNAGQMPLVFSQLQRDGYAPVGGGFQRTGENSSRFVTFFKTQDSQWLAATWNASTAQVLIRGTQMEIGTWGATTEAAFTPVQAGQEQCLPFEQVKNNVLRKNFSDAVTLQGRLASGETMRTYIQGGNWLAVKIRPDADRTTCLLAMGEGFQMAPPIPAAPSIGH